MTFRLSAAALLACALAACIPVAGQGLTRANPESVGLSPERLERIAAVVQKNIDEKRLAGAVTLVW
jgi:hypothetical protein